MLLQIQSFLRYHLVVEESEKRALSLPLPLCAKVSQRLRPLNQSVFVRQHGVFSPGHASGGSRRGRGVSLVRHSLPGRLSLGVD